ncbi:MAG: hypothetical protein IJ011_03960 [Clostridia bacterium]|nr:hypothetical protein [Clostridia bacterium]
MSKKTLIKAIVVLLTLTMVAAVFAGCNTDKNTDGNESNSGDVVDTNDTSSNTTEEDTARYDSNGYLMDDLPDDLWYDGADVTILGWSDTACTEFDVTEISKDAISNSVYKRDQAIQTKLGIKMKYTLTAGGAKSLTNFKTAVSNAYYGSTPYDIIASYTRSTAICATDGMLYDLSSLPSDSYLNLNKPWWNDSVIEKTTTSTGKFYFVTGDASTSLAQMIYCVYFNADEVDRMRETSPYELVESNEWTLDTMMTMTKNYYVDLDESKSVSIKDKIGVVGYYYDWPALLHGCGVGFVTKNGLGEFILDPNIKTGRGLDVMNDLLTWTTTEKSLCRGRDAEGNTMSNFAAGNSMFIITHSGAAITDLNDVQFEYGCVPCPKYDEDQETYYSAVRQPVTFFGIMTNVKSDRVEMITAVLEAWGSEGYRTTTPVIFEKAMKDASATSAFMSDMLQLIRDTAWFDCGRIYAQEMLYICDKPGDYLAAGTSWDNYVGGEIEDVEEQGLTTLNIMLND